MINRGRINLRGHLLHWWDSLSQEVSNSKSLWIFWDVYYLNGVKIIFLKLNLGMFLEVRHASRLPLDNLWNCPFAFSGPNSLSNELCKIMVMVVVLSFFSLSFFSLIRINEVNENPLCRCSWNDAVMELCRSPYTHCQETAIPTVTWTVTLFIRFLPKLGRILPPNSYGPQ